MNDCPHGLHIETETCEKCQMERDLGLVWRENRHGERKLVKKGYQSPKVVMGYAHTKKRGDHGKTR